MPSLRLASSSSGKAPTWMIQPPFGRGFAACAGASVGSVNGATAATLAVATLAGRMPRTPGRAPGGGGRASVAGAGVAGAGVAGGVAGAGAAARTGSLGRGRPANGIAADADADAD